MSKALLKSTTVVGGMTLISRLLGFVRDMVAAHFFGAGLGYDAFLTAFKIPNFMRRLFAEGAFSQAFVPVLSEYRSQEEFSVTQNFINQVAGTLGLILTLMTVLGILLAPVVVFIFAPGFLNDPVRFNLASDMLRITFPYLLLISLTAFSGGILNTYGRFAVPSFTPVFLNIAMIAAAIFLSQRLETPILALAWGVLAGGVLQLLFQIPFLMKEKLLPKPKINWRDPGVRKVLRLMVPALFGVSVNQINLILDTAFASFLPIGSVSWLYYSDRLMEFPLGVFGVALATVVLPHLSKNHIENRPEGYKQSLDWALRWVVLIGIPASIGLYMLAGPLLTTLFQYGKFSTFDVEMANRSLMAYALGLMGFIVVKVLASAYYARQNMKTPVKIALVAMITNVVLNALLIGPFQHAGLAFATSFAALLNALLLFIGLWRCRIYSPMPGWGRFALRVLFANTVLVLSLILGSYDIKQWFDWDSWHRVLHLFSLIGISGFLYVFSLWIMGLRAKHIIFQAELAPSDVNVSKS